MKNTNQITEKPQLPLISIYKNRGIEIINNETIKYFNKANAYNLIQNSSDTEMYSSKMKIWNLEQKTTEFKNTKWNRFLAKTIYNPSFEVVLFWKQINTYELEELKAKIKNCIEKDDDMLTQFVDANFFTYKIEQASNFSQIINTLNTYRFNIRDEENIWKENEEWNKQNMSY